MHQACRRRLAQPALLCAAAMLSVGAPSLAQGQTVDVHGIVSQGFLKTTRNNYLALTEQGSFEFTEAVLNITRPLDDTLNVGFQLFARDLGPIGNYDARFDW